METISINSPRFAGLRADFDVALRDAFRRMLKNGVNEGRVTVTLNITLVDDEAAGTHGIGRMVKTPVFEHKTKSTVASAWQSGGTASMQGSEVYLDENGDPTIRQYGGQMSMFDVEDSEEEGEGEE